MNGPIWIVIFVVYGDDHFYTEGLCRADLNWRKEDASNKYLLASRHAVFCAKT